MTGISMTVMDQAHLLKVHLGECSSILTRLFAQSFFNNL